MYWFGGVDVDAVAAAVQAPTGPSKRHLRCQPCDVYWVTEDESDLCWNCERPDNVEPGRKGVINGPSRAYGPSDEQVAAWYPDPVERLVDRAAA